MPVNMLTQATIYRQIVAYGRFNKKEKEEGVKV